MTYAEFLEIFSDEEPVPEDIAVHLHPDLRWIDDIGMCPSHRQAAGAVEQLGGLLQLLSLLLPGARAGTVAVRWAETGRFRFLEGSAFEHFSTPQTRHPVEAPPGLGLATLD
jgi:hypothetical protein